jgi:hypothetical protein
MTRFAMVVPLHHTVINSAICHVQVTREDHRVVVAAAFWISMSMDLAMELRKS